ncbi:hypothetical protein DH2020_027436 [Rehmannia glutinosa]|uniref:Uncharacterized protein n=1 Tax=Rehmannia glutinosa TaxID=99300 RepID=A0ABR0VXM7_REHGL
MAEGAARMVVNVPPYGRGGTRRGFNTNRKVVEEELKRVATQVGSRFGDQSRTSLP